MADSRHITRRSAFVGALALPGLMSIPAHANEDAASKVERLADELSEALRDYAGGGFRAIVDADDVRLTRAVVEFDLKAWLAEQTPKGRANYHQGELANAMCELNPGQWQTNATHDHVWVQRMDLTAAQRPSVFVQYLY